MLRQFRVVVLVALCLSGCGGGDGTANGRNEESGSSSVDTRPPPKPPPVDPDAGAPMFLAINAERHILLDSAGRVARVLPRTMEPEDTHPCRGGRVWVYAPEWGEEIAVRTVDGKLLWRRRIAPTSLDAIRCLDDDGRRIAIVPEYDDSPPSNRSYWWQRLVVVSRKGTEYGPRFIGTTPLLARDRMYVSDERGVQIRSVPGFTLRGRVPGGTGIHDIAPAPDHRFAVLTWAPDTDDVFLLADLTTRETRAIEIPGMQVVGWLAPDRLAVRADGNLIVLDLELREVARVPDFRATDDAVADGEVLAIDGSELIAVRPGARPPRTLGRVPKGTDLIGALSALD